VKKFRPRVTYANVVATLALFIALGGASYAATRLPNNSVRAPQIAKNAVGSSELRDHAAVRPADVSRQLAKGLQRAIGDSDPFRPGRGESACKLYGGEACIDLESSKHYLHFMESHTWKLSCESGYEMLTEGGLLSEGPAIPKWVANTGTNAYTGAALALSGKSGSFTLTNWDTHKHHFIAVAACEPKEP